LYVELATSQSKFPKVYTIASKRAKIIEGGEVQELRNRTKPEIRNGFKLNQNSIVQNAPRISERIKATNRGKEICFTLVNK